MLFRSNYSTGLGPPCFTPDGSQIECMGSRDYRPTPSAGSKCSYYCRDEAKADGLYLEHVYGAVYGNFDISPE